jgi:uncharacterized protein YjbI with pentapeptide repeats
VKALFVGVGVCCVLLAGCGSGLRLSDSEPAADGETVVERTASCEFSADEIDEMYFVGLDGGIDDSLVGRSLSDCDLTGVDLTEATLVYTDLVDADLTNADLRGADLTNADLTRADLSNANLTDAILRNAELGGVKWSNTKCPNGSVQSTPCQ